MFEYGEDFTRHIEAVGPTFRKVLVRHHAEGNCATNQAPAAISGRYREYVNTFEKSRSVAAAA
jgi:hypothetical protein